MAAHEGFVAKLQPLVEDRPELVHIPTGGEGHVHQVDGDHALIEAAVILGLSSLRVHIGGQEGAAAHAGVAVALAVFVHLVAQHDLFRDIVGDHALGGAFGGQLGQVVVGGVGVDVVLLQHIDQLGEGGGDPHAGLVLHALVALVQGLLDDESQILLLLLVFGLAQVHEHGDEGSLTVGGHQGDHLVLDGLHAPADLLPQALFHDTVHHLGVGGAAADGDIGQHLGLDLLAGHVHEGGQMGQGNGLAAVLVGGHLGNDLSGDVAGSGEAVGLLDHGAGDDGAVLQHILQIDQVAVVHVLGIVVHIVEVDDAGLMGLHDLLRQQQTAGDILAHLAGHVVTLDRVDGGVFVGVLLLGFLVVALDEGEDLPVGGIGGPYQIVVIAVADVALGGLIGAALHDAGLHHLLHLLHGGGAAHLLAGLLDLKRNPVDLLTGELGRAVGGVVGLGDRRGDLHAVELGFGTAALHDLHQAIAPL